MKAKQLFCGATELYNSPLVLDAHGGLYALSSGGATIKIEKAESEESEKVLAFGESVAGRWVCTDRYLKVYISNADRWVGKALGQMPYLWTLPYPNVCSYNTIEETFVVAKGKDCIFCADIKKEGIQDYTIPSNDWIYTAWVAEDYYGMAGMSPRTIDADGYIEAWGRPVLIRVAGSKWQREELTGLELSNDILDVVIRAEKKMVNKELFRKFSKRSYPQIRIETILDLVCCNEKIIFVCSLKYDSVEEESWEMSEEACMNNYHMFSLIELENGGLNLVEYIHKATYACSVEIGGDKYLYFPNSLKTKSKDWLKCIFVKQNGCDYNYEVRLGGIDGLKEGSEVFWFKIWYDPRIGPYGCIGVFSKKGSAYYLIRSKDAVNWKVVHRLEEYPR